MKIALKIQPEIRQDDVYTTEVIYQNQTCNKITEYLKGKHFKANYDDYSIY